MDKLDNKKGLKLCFISVTHGKHHELNMPEDIDILIHCGDMSSIGYKWQIKDFLDWFSEQKARYRCLISGNHDFWFEPGHVRNSTLKPGENPRDIIPEGIIYLEDEHITIEGIKIFGSPWTPWFHSWAFNAHRGEAIKAHWDLIESDVDIVITHGPPANTYLDRCRNGDRVGCSDLARKLAEIQPKICASGHIHEAYGTENKEILDIEDQEAPGKIMKLINASVLNLQYEMTNDPIVIDWDEMCEMHENKKNLKMKTTTKKEEFVFFWGGSFSQWCPSTFVIDGVEFNCCEQYMMYKKALMFHDYKIASDIMKTTSPKKQKSLGRKVSNFDKNIWEKYCRKIVYDANMAKFTQNPDMFDELMSTDDKEFCEASPYDKIWGVGLSEDNPLIQDKANWQGTNWLGEALTKVRNNLR